MKSYNTIPYYGDYWNIPVIGFDKLDGSNIRSEWSKKRGFYKFGTRNVMIDENSEQFGMAVKIFKEKYNDSLSSIFTSKEYRNIQSFVCFAEFVGSKPCFGQHDFENDTFDTILFDISQYKKGFVPPRQFINDFGNIGIPRIVYDGNLNMDLIKRVKSNEFGLSEGIIAKGLITNKKGNDNLYYCKIKTDDWFNRLRNKSPKEYELELKQAKINLVD